MWDVFSLPDPLFLFIAWVWKGEYIPNYIPDHVLTELMLVILDGYFWISFPKNSIKLVRACILGACLFSLSLLLEGLREELTIMDRSSSVSWTLHYIDPLGQSNHYPLWNKQSNSSWNMDLLLIKEIRNHYLPCIIFHTGVVYIVSRPLHLIWPFNN